MNANTPEELYTLYAQALNTRDLEAAVDLFEPEAQMAPQPGMAPVIGTEAIRGLVQACLTVQPQLKLEARNVIQNDDIALMTSNWSMTGIHPETMAPFELTGSGTQVVRRQADGTWRYIIDDAWGASS